jgi:hypothetical protein
MTITTGPKQYSEPGRCIYCGPEEGRGRALTSEHIIALGLGGNLVIPKASCFRCSKVTCKNEDAALRRMFSAARTHLNLPSRRPKKRPKTIPIKVHFGDGRSINIELGRDESPFVFTMWGFRPAEFLGGDRSDGLESLWFYGTGNPSDLHRWGNTHITAPGVTDSNITVQLLAKIAHSYAAAELGIDNYSPLLVPLIFERNIPRMQMLGNQLVGGLCTEDKQLKNPPNSTFLHELWLEGRSYGGRDLIVVGIRLFGCLGSPLYEVVAGENPKTSISSRTARIQQR